MGGGCTADGGTGAGLRAGVNRSTGREAVRALVHAQLLPSISQVIEDVVGVRAAREAAHLDGIDHPLGLLVGR